MSPASMSLSFVFSHSLGKYKIRFQLRKVEIDSRSVILPQLNFLHCQALEDFITFKVEEIIVPLNKNIYEIRQ